MDKRDLEIKVIELTKQAAKAGVSQKDIINAIQSVLSVELSIKQHQDAMARTY